ncbi:MAG: NPCBM/NEW2 domain-containing protein [Victivallaceae bacterium]|nr:NPCBM/NEW2 domain-containing protein [Victivallaceae bacterium]
MKLITMTVLFGLALVTYSGEQAAANTFRLTGNTEKWQCFKWVKDGTAELVKDDDTPVLKLTSESGKKGIHYYLDREIPIIPDLSIQVSYEWRGKLGAGKKAYISSGFYMHDSKGRYIASAVSAGGNIIKSSTMTIWKGHARTVKIPTKGKGKTLKFVKFFFALTKGAKVEIKNLKVVIGTQKKSPEIVKTAKFRPLIKQTTTFPLGKNWTQRKIGKQDFYLAEQGNYIRMKPKTAWRYYETGIFPTMIPGHWRLKEFAPGAKLLPWQQTEVNDFLNKRWPLFSINYQRMFGNPAPSKSTIKRVDHIWIGDGQPEEPIYRLEPVFHFLKTDKKWKGSSMYLWKDKYAVDYLKNELKPLLEKELPGCTKANYQWDRKKLKKLKDLYCLSYLAINARPLCWTMYLSPYAIAERKDLVTVAAKGADAYLLALTRGVNRQSGGNKFTLSWRGHEPTEQFTYQQRDFYNKPSRENWGYPLPHLKYYIFRPYLVGINYYMNEGFPGSLIYDLEDNKTFRLTPVGRITKDLINYTKRVPQRGTIYTPIALVQGWYRGLNERDYGGKIAFDRADWMNYALIKDLLLPEHRDTRNSGSYSVTAPYGEIIDLLKPNPEKIVDPKIFDGYKVLILTGGLTLSPQYKKTLENYVKTGGIIVINAVDAKQNFNSYFTGIEIGKTLTASVIKNVKTGKQFKERKFKYLALTLKEATPLYVTGKAPVVTSNKYGSGNVIVTAPKYLLTSEKSVTIEGRIRKQTLRPLLLNFCDDFFGNLFASVTPFMVNVAPEHRPDISWVISKQGDDWTVAMFNYSLKREELVARALGTAKVTATYPYKSVPFEIVANVPANDVVELFAERDVKYQKVKGKLVVQESMQGGDILIYKFSRQKIKLSPYKRYINLALNKPVTVSSTYKQFAAGYAVDGSDNNDYFWQSGVTKRQFTMPQWLTVDLGQTTEIDHVKLVFHVWQQLALAIRKNIYRYQIQTSIDGKEWTTVIDESKNESPAELGGTGTWFKTVNARYVKLLVLRNASYSGAQVVEFAVMGKNTELYQPKRQSIVPKWKVSFPTAIEQATGKQVKYLRSIKPLQVKPGWMPTGKKWSQLNGWVRLYTDVNNLKGAAYSQSLYGESVFEVEYAIPPNTKYFAAMCGFGNRDRRASVEFKVYVDGKLKYDSGMYRIGMRLLPVVVDIAGNSKLKLVTTDAGDGIVADYAWWGDARFILQ